jgi:hypothetical protein
MHKDDGISLTFEAFMRGSNMFRSHQAPPSLLELYIIYYLKLLLPCADYFETILVDYYQQK